MRRAIFTSIWRRLAGFFRAFSRSQTPSEPPIAPENVTQAPAPSVPQDTLVIDKACMDRNGHDLQVGDTVAAIEGTGHNVWYVCQIADCGEFQYVHILRWRPYYVVSHHPKHLSVNTDIERGKELPSTGIMERRVSINSDLIFLERHNNDLGFAERPVEE